MFSIDGSFDYSSIDELVFINLVNHPTSIHQIIGGIDTRPIPRLSRKCSFKDVSSDNKLESRVSNSSDLSSDSHSLASTREESDSSLDSIYRDSSSSSENHNISSFISSSISPKEDLTSCSP